MNVTKKTHLRATVKRKSVIEIVSVNAPTFLIGLDYKKADYFKSKGFIIILNTDPKSAKTISAVSVKKPLNPTNLKLLEKEVLDFWNKSNCLTNKLTLTSKFV